MTDDLVAWLRAQLDEDEREAKELWLPEELMGTIADTKRVLAEVAAKKEILDFYEVAATHDDSSLGVATLRAVIRCLAKPYAGRPGWREEWRA